MDIAFVRFASKIVMQGTLYSRLLVIKKALGQAFVIVVKKAHEAYALLVDVQKNLNNNKI